MNEEKFNTEIRKFLKQVGITAQREIEKAVWSQLEKKQLKGDEKLAATMRLEIPSINLKLDIKETISLE